MAVSAREGWCVFSAGPGVSHLVRRFTLLTTLSAQIQPLPYPKFHSQCIVIASLIDTPSRRRAPPKIDTQPTSADAG
jgi:hypothetical protein